MLIAPLPAGGSRLPLGEAVPGLAPRVVLNRVRIGTGSVVAAGAVVPEGMIVPPGSVVMGVPARVVRSVDPVLAERIAGTWSRYVEFARLHRRGEFRAVPTQ